MQAARKLYAPQQMQHSSQAVAPRPRRRHARMGWLAYVLFAAAWLSVVSTAIFLVSRHAEIAQMAYRVGDLQREISLVEDENVRLRAQTSELKSLSRIEKIATTKLGMVKPGVIQVAMVEMPVVAQSEDEQQVTQIAAPNNSLWGRFRQFVSGLRIGSGRAEATGRR